MRNVNKRSFSVLHYVSACRLSNVYSGMLALFGLGNIFVVCFSVVFYVDTWHVTCMVEVTIF